jgi:hypothetical protein
MTSVAHAVDPGRGVEVLAVDPHPLPAGRVPVLHRQRRDRVRQRHRREGAVVEAGLVASRHRLAEKPAGVERDDPRGRSPGGGSGSHCGGSLHGDRPSSRLGGNGPGALGVRAKQGPDCHAGRSPGRRTEEHATRHGPVRPGGARHGAVSPGVPRVSG